MFQENLIIFIIAFTLSIFVLRLIRFVITAIFGEVEKFIEMLLGKRNPKITRFFLKIDYIVNEMRILGIRWHILLAFLYVSCVQLQILYKI